MLFSEDQLSNNQNCFNLTSGYTPTFIETEVILEIPNAFTPDADGMSGF